MQEPTINPATSMASSGDTPGKLLKIAREEKGMSVIDVASRLCLSAQFIEDIERDDYSHMSARAYARGYVVSYANLVGVPEAKILSAIANVQMEFTSAKNAVTIDNDKSVPIYHTTESSQQRSSLLLWGTILVLIILIGLVVMWWKGPSMPTNKSDTTQPTPVSIQPQTSAPAPTAPPAALTPPASSRPPAAPTPPAANDQSVMQPSEVKNPAPAVALPAPRASIEG